MNALALLVLFAVWTGPLWKNGQTVPAAFAQSSLHGAGPLHQRVTEHPPLDPNSERYIAYYFAGNASEFEAGWIDANASQEKYDYNFPVYTASAEDPLVTIFCNHLSPAPCSDDGVRIHLPTLARQAGGEDHHLAVLEPDGTEYDFWLVASHPPYRTGARLSAAGEGHYALDGSSTEPNAAAPGWDVGAATAGGIALSVGQIYTSELASGIIHHALSLVFPCGSNAWVYPASQATGICAHGRGMPLGSRVWWQPDDASTRAMPLPHDMKTILIALHQYGGFFTDNGDGVKDIDGRGGGMGAHLENQEPYWLYAGGTDPALAYAAHAPDWIHVKTAQGVDHYLLTAAGSDLDFLHNLKVLAPCLTRRTC